MISLIEEDGAIEIGINNPKLTNHYIKYQKKTWLDGVEAQLYERQLVVIDDEIKQPFNTVNQLLMKFTLDYVSNLEDKKSVKSYQLGSIILENTSTI